MMIVSSLQDDKASATAVTLREPFEESPNLLIVAISQTTSPVSDPPVEADATGQIRTQEELTAIRAHEQTTVLLFSPPETPNIEMQEMLSAT